MYVNKGKRLHLVTSFSTIICVSLSTLPNHVLANTHLSLQAPLSYAQHSRSVYRSDTALETPAVPEGRPPSRLGEEIVGGFFGAFLGAGLGFGAAFGVCWLFAREEKTGQVIGGMYGAAIGYPIGSAAGVFAAGDTPTETGSGFATLLGTCVGTVGLGLITLGPGALVGGPVGGAIGFNMTRRYKTPQPVEEGLMNIKKGGLRLALPAPTIRHDTYNRDMMVHEMIIISASF